MFPIIGLGLHLILEYWISLLKPPNQEKPASKYMKPVDILPCPVLLLALFCWGAGSTEGVDTERVYPVVWMGGMI